MQLRHSGGARIGGVAHDLCGPWLFFASISLSECNACPGAEGRYEAPSMDIAAERALKPSIRLSLYGDSLRTSGAPMAVYRHDMGEGLVYATSLLSNLSSLSTMRWLARFVNLLLSWPSSS